MLERDLRPWYELWSFSWALAPFRNLSCLSYQVAPCLKLIMALLTTFVVVAHATRDDPIPRRLPSYFASGCNLLFLISCAVLWISAAFSVRAAFHCRKVAMAAPLKQYIFGKASSKIKEIIRSQAPPGVHMRPLNKQTMNTIAGHSPPKLTDDVSLSSDKDLIKKSTKDQKVKLKKYTSTQNSKSQTPTSISKLESQSDTDLISQPLLPVEAPQPSNTSTTLPPPKFCPPPQTLIAPFSSNSYVSNSNPAICSQSLSSSPQGSPSLAPTTATASSPTSSPTISSFSVSPSTASRDASSPSRCNKLNRRSSTAASTSSSNSSSIRSDSSNSRLRKSNSTQHRRKKSGLRRHSRNAHENGIDVTDYFSEGLPGPVRLLWVVESTLICVVLALNLLYLTVVCPIILSTPNPDYPFEITNKIWTLLGAPTPSAEEENIGDGGDDEENTLHTDDLDIHPDDSQHQADDVNGSSHETVYGGVVYNKNSELNTPIDKIQEKIHSSIFLESLNFNFLSDTKDFSYHSSLFEGVTFKGDDEEGIHNYKNILNAQFSSEKEQNLMASISVDKDSKFQHTNEILSPTYIFADSTYPLLNSKISSKLFFTNNENSYHSINTWETPTRRMQAAQTGDSQSNNDDSNSKSWFHAIPFVNSTIFSHFFHFSIQFLNLFCSFTPYRYRFVLPAIAVLIVKFGVESALLWADYSFITSLKAPHWEVKASHMLRIIPNHLDFNHEADRQMAVWVSISLIVVFMPFCHFLLWFVFKLRDKFILARVFELSTINARYQKLRIQRILANNAREQRKAQLNLEGQSADDEESHSEIGDSNLPLTNEEEHNPGCFSCFGRPSKAFHLARKDLAVKFSLMRAFAQLQDAENKKLKQEEAKRIEMEITRAKQRPTGRRSTLGSSASPSSNLSSTSANATLNHAASTSPSKNAASRNIVGDLEMRMASLAKRRAHRASILTKLGVQPLGSSAKGGYLTNFTPTTANSASLISASNRQSVSELIASQTVVSLRIAHKQKLLVPPPSTSAKKSALLACSTLQQAKKVVASIIQLSTEISSSDNNLNRDNSNKDTSRCLNSQSQNNDAPLPFAFKACDLSEASSAASSFVESENEQNSYALSSPLLGSNPSGEQEPVKENKSNWLSRFFKRSSSSTKNESANSRLSHNLKNPNNNKINISSNPDAFIPSMGLQPNGVRSGSMGKIRSVPLSSFFGLNPDMTRVLVPLIEEEGDSEEIQMREWIRETNKRSYVNDIVLSGGIVNLKARKQMPLPVATLGKMKMREDDRIALDLKRQILEEREVQAAMKGQLIFREDVERDLLFEGNANADRFIRAEQNQMQFRTQIDGELPPATSPCEINVSVPMPIPNANSVSGRGLRRNGISQPVIRRKRAPSLGFSFAPDEGDISKLTYEEEINNENAHDTQISPSLHEIPKCESSVTLPTLELTPPTRDNISLPPSTVADVLLPINTTKNLAASSSPSLKLMPSASIPHSCPSADARFILPSPVNIHFQTSRRPVESIWKVPGATYLLNTGASSDAFEEDLNPNYMHLPNKNNTPSSYFSSNDSLKPSPPAQSFGGLQLSSPAISTLHPPSSSSIFTGAGSNLQQGSNRLNKRSLLGHLTNLSSTTATSNNANQINASSISVAQAVISSIQAASSISTQNGGLSGNNSNNNNKMNSHPHHYESTTITKRKFYPKSGVTGRSIGSSNVSPLVSQPHHNAHHGRRKKFLPPKLESMWAATPEDSMITILGAVTRGILDSQLKDLTDAFNAAAAAADAAEDGQTAYNDMSDVITTHHFEVDGHGGVLENVADDSDRTKIQNELLDVARFGGLTPSPAMTSSRIPHLFKVQSPSLQDGEKSFQNFDLNGNTANDVSEYSDSFAESTFSVENGKLNSMYHPNILKLEDEGVISADENKSENHKKRISSFSSSTTIKQNSNILSRNADQSHTSSLIHNENNNYHSYSNFFKNNHSLFNFDSDHSENDNLCTFLEDNINCKPSPTSNSNAIKHRRLLSIAQTASPIPSSIKHLSSMGLHHSLASTSHDQQQHQQLLLEKAASSLISSQNPTVMCAPDPSLLLESPISSTNNTPPRGISLFKQMQVVAATSSLDNPSSAFHLKNFKPPIKDFVNTGKAFSSALSNKNSPISNTQDQNAFHSSSKALLSTPLSKYPVASRASSVSSSMPLNSLLGFESLSLRDLSTPFAQSLSNRSRQVSQQVSRQVSIKTPAHTVGFASAEKVTPLVLPFASSDRREQSDRILSQLSQVTRLISSVPFGTPNSSPSNHDGSHSSSNNNSNHQQHSSDLNNLNDCLISAARDVAVASSLCRNINDSTDQYSPSPHLIPNTSSSGLGSTLLLPPACEVSSADDDGHQKMSSSVTRPRINLGHSPHFKVAADAHSIALTQQDASELNSLIPLSDANAVATRSQLGSALAVAAAAVAAVAASHKSMRTRGTHHTTSHRSNFHTSEDIAADGDDEVDFSSNSSSLYHEREIRIAHRPSSDRLESGAGYHHNGKNSYSSSSENEFVWSASSSSSLSEASTKGDSEIEFLEEKLEHGVIARVFMKRHKDKKNKPKLKTEKSSSNINFVRSLKCVVNSNHFNANNHLGGANNVHNNSVSLVAKKSTASNHIHRLRSTPLRKSTNSCNIIPPGHQQHRIVPHGSTNFVSTSPFHPKALKSSPFFGPSKSPFHHPRILSSPKAKCSFNNYNNNSTGDNTSNHSQATTSHYKPFDDLDLGLIHEHRLSHHSGEVLVHIPVHRRIPKNAEDATQRTSSVAPSVRNSSKGLFMNQFLAPDYRKSESSKWISGRTLLELEEGVTIAANQVKPAVVSSVPPSSSPFRLHKDFENKGLLASFTTLLRTDNLISSSSSSCSLLDLDPVEDGNQ